MRAYRKNNWLWALSGAIFVVVISALLGVSMCGKTEISNAEGHSEQSIALSCEDKETTYPFYDSKNSKNHLMKIGVIFDSNRIDAISLIYQVEYDDVSISKQYTTNNSVTMNSLFKKDGLGMDALGMNFSSLNSTMQMTLYAKTDDINDISAKYFLLDNVTGYTQNDLKSAYEKKGFLCSINK